MEQDSKIFSRTVRGCFQTKKLPAFVDADGQIRSKRFEKHLQSCSHCRAAFDKYTARIQDINKMIPFRELTQDQFQEVERDIFSIYKVIQKDIRKKSPKRDFSGIIDFSSSLKKQFTSIPFWISAIFVAVVLILNL